MPKYSPVSENTKPSYKAWLNNNIDRFNNIPVEEGGDKVFGAGITDRLLGSQFSRDFLALLEGQQLTLDDRIPYLRKLVERLDGMKEDNTVNVVFNSPEGDVATAKDLVGNFLATLAQEDVTIN